VDAFCSSDFSSNSIGSWLILTNWSCRNARAPCCEFTALNEMRVKMKFKKKRLLGLGVEVFFVGICKNGLTMLWCKVYRFRIPTRADRNCQNPFLWRFLAITKIIPTLSSYELRPDRIPVLMHVMVQVLIANTYLIKALQNNKGVLILTPKFDCSIFGTRDRQVENFYTTLNRYTNRLLSASWWAWICQLQVDVSCTKNN
jgi:hypothetical protein